MNKPNTAWTLAALLGLAASAPLQAQDLLEAWRGAEQHDRALAVARADHAASQSRREQADAMGRPQIHAGQTAGWGNSQQRMEGAQFSTPAMGTSGGVNFGTSVNSGLATRSVIMAQYPLLNGARDAGQEQLRTGAGMGAVAWRAARSEAMLRTVQRYFDLALAEEALRLAERQLAAVQRAQTEAHESFALGELPVTDIHEADAALAGVRAQVEAARLQVALAQRALSDATGLVHPTAHLPRHDTEPGEDVRAWIDAAMAGSPQLQLAQQGVRLARQDMERRRAAGRPTLDLVAQAGLDRIHGHGDYGRATNRNRNAVVGVQLNVPLYDGGMSRAQASEGARLVERARAQLEQAREQVVQQVRAAWLGWHSSQARVAALEDGLKASAARLDATRLGRKAGDRTLLDVLNAENDHAQAALALAQARTGQVQQRLMLAALADRLDEALLAQVNAALGGPGREGAQPAAGHDAAVRPATAAPPATAERPAKPVRNMAPAPARAPHPPAVRTRTSSRKDGKS